MLGALAIGVGYVAAASAPSLCLFAMAQRLLRLRHVDRIRPADRRHLTLVRAPPRHCRRHLRLRQLFRRRDLAADRAAFHRRRRLARDASRHRHFLLRRAAAARAFCCGRRRDCTRHAAENARACRQRLRHFTGALQVLLCDRRRRLLRRHVDAAGSSRRLLRRSRLRRRARRRHARDHDGVRHRQPDRVGIYRRLRRRPAHAAAWLVPASRRAAAVCAVRRPDVALRHFRAVRPVPGRHRAELRHHRARVFFAARSGRPARCHPDGDAVRHGVRAAGCRALSSISPAPTVSLSSTALRGTAQRGRSSSG